MSDAPNGTSGSESRDRDTSRQDPRQWLAGVLAGGDAEGALAVAEELLARLEDAAE